jgi:hypothetical protein
MTFSGNHKFATLVLQALTVCAHTQIDCNTLRSSHCSTPIYTLPARIFAQCYAENNCFPHGHIVQAETQVFCGVADGTFKRDFCIAINSAISRVVAVSRPRLRTD